MTVDRAAIRKRLVEGWRPRMSVQIEVRELKALLDELDEAHALLDRAKAALEKGAELERQVHQTRFELRRVQAQGDELTRQGDRLRALLEGFDGLGRLELVKPPDEVPAAACGEVGKRPVQVPRDEERRAPQHERGEGEGELDPGDPVHGA